MAKERMYINNIDRVRFYNNTTLVIDTKEKDEYRFTFCDIKDVKKVYEAIRRWGEWTEDDFREWEEHEYERWSLD